MKSDRLKTAAKIAGGALGVTAAGMKIAAEVTKNHEYDEENREALTAVVPKKENCYEKYIKRAIDVTLSFGGLVVLAPVYAAVSLAIVIDDPGPVLFSQKRVGIHKTYFKLHKFRSMKMSTPHDMPTHLLENPDQYITRVGRFIRKYSLDELPQIWDIFVGNMSIIGPRPALWNQFDLIAERDKYEANDVRPGLTGWAQINGRDELEIDVKAKLDGDYTAKLRKGSLSGLMMDIRCFIGTIFSVARAEGVVEGGTGEMKKQEKTENTEDKSSDKESTDKATSSVDSPEEANAAENRGNDEEKKKKLLAVTNHSYMFWKFRRELMAELQKDYEVIISTPFVGHEEDFEAMGCRMIETPVDRRGMNPKTDFKLFRTYCRMLKKEKPDMVLTYSIKPNLYAGFACRLLGIPYCVNVQGLGTAFQSKPLAFVAAFLYKVACRKAKTVFFENRGNAGYFTDHHIIPEKKVTVLPGAGVNLDYYQNEAYPQHKEVRFLYLGRIMREKGLDELFYAIRKLHEKYGDRVQLDLVGFFEDEYKETVDQLTADGIAVFHGFKEDTRPSYSNADCVVLPSYHEGMSNVLLEAAASGRCLVTSDIPGCREAVEDGRTGFLCRVKDPESLLEAMEKVMAADKEGLKTFGENGRRKMEDEFSKKVVVEQTKKAITA